MELSPGLFHGPYSCCLAQSKTLLGFILVALQVASPSQEHRQNAVSSFQGYLGRADSRQEIKMCSDDDGDPLSTADGGH